jgi:hypothetical protein
MMLSSPNSSACAAGAATKGPRPNANNALALVPIPITRVRRRAFDLLERPTLRERLRAAITQPLKNGNENPSALAKLDLRARPEEDLRADF